MSDESKQRLVELADALAVEDSNPSALEMYYRAFPNIQHREWDKAEKARGAKNVEIVRDKFPQAFKEHLANKASDSVATPSTSKLSNSKGTGRKLVDNIISRTPRCGTK